MSRIPCTILFAVLSFTAAFAQTTNSKSASVQATKETLLTQHWKFTGAEEFGMMKKANTKEANDEARFDADHKASITSGGVPTTGLWSMDKYAGVLTLAVDNSTEKRPYKICKLVSDTLVLEYKDSSLVKTKYHFLRQP